MESLDNPTQDLQELSFRVSKLRVSLRMKRRRSTVSTASTDSSSTTETASVAGVDNSRLQVPVGPDSASSGLSSSSFRSRLSSHSSVCSTDSGFLSARSRSRVGSSSSATGTPVGGQTVSGRPRLGSASSTASSSSRTGSILHRIAKSHGEKATKNADSEFSMLYYRPRSSTFSSTTSRGVARSVSNASSVSISSTGSRNRSFSVSSATADYAEVYSMVDPFDEEDDETTAIPPPLPPRCARLRSPALPPYPSSAVTLVQNISESILC